MSEQCVGQQSCPAVRVYSGGNLEASLEAATRRYLRQEVEARGGALRLPQLLQWYQNDFAHDQTGMLRCVVVLWSIAVLYYLPGDVVTFVL